MNIQRLFKLYHLGATIPEHLRETFSTLENIYNNLHIFKETSNKDLKDSTFFLDNNNEVIIEFWFWKSQKIFQFFYDTESFLFFDKYDIKYNEIMQIFLMTINKKFDFNVKVDSITSTSKQREVKWQILENVFKNKKPN